MYTFVFLIVAVFSERVKLIYDEPLPPSASPSLTTTAVTTKPVPYREPRPIKWPPSLLNLSGSCFTLDPTPNHRYSYELCMFRNITQRDSPSSWNSFWGLLGLWDAWKPGSSNLVGLFTDGTECGVTKQRRTAEVELTCSVGGAYVLKGVKEPHQCKYTMMFACPEACGLDLSGLDENFNASSVNSSTVSPSPSIPTVSSPSVPPLALSSSSPLASPAPVTLNKTHVESAEVVLNAALEVLKTTKITLEAMERRLTVLESKERERGVGESEVFETEALLQINSPPKMNPLSSPNKVELLVEQGKQEILGEQGKNVGGVGAGEVSGGDVSDKQANPSSRRKTPKANTNNSNKAVK